MENGKTSTEEIRISQEPKGVKGEKRGINVWQWIEENKAIALSVGVVIAMSFILTAFALTQIYIQSQKERRQLEERQDRVFLTLVKQLSSTVEERKTAIVALAQLDDPRALTMLVDLLAGETNPTLMRTLDQALVDKGPATLPPLKILNQSLIKDYKALGQSSSLEERRAIALQLRTTKRVIGKILTLYSGQLESVNLEGANLGPQSNSVAQFSLTLEAVDLSGINLRGAILDNGNLKNTIFASAGKEGLVRTGEKAIADLSEANLQSADLTEAFLSNVLLKGSNLLHANLDRADLSGAQLQNSNLSSAKLIGASLEKAVLEGASLTGANLTAAKLSKANLAGTNLGRIKAVRADFSFTDLTRATANGGDFSQANLSNANLMEIKLSSAQLQGANLRNTKLGNANLENANLSSANLEGANLAGANFQGVTFALRPLTTEGKFVVPKPIEDTIAKIKGVDFSQVRNLNKTQIDLICAEGGIHSQCSN